MLIAAAQADPTAFDQLYRHYVTPMYRYCAVRLGERQAAEDATSEIFLRALRGLSSFRGGEFAAWLYQIAHNVVIDSYRRERQASNAPDEREPVDLSLTPDEMAIAHDENARMRLAIARLPEAQRAAIELQLAGWTTAEIGAALGKSPETMRVFRFRALKQLRALLLATENDPESRERPHG